MKPRDQSSEEVGKIRMMRIWSQDTVTRVEGAVSPDTHSLSPTSAKGHPHVQSQQVRGGCLKKPDSQNQAVRTTAEPLR